MVSLFKNHLGELFKIEILQCPHPLPKKTLLVGEDFGQLLHDFYYWNQNYKSCEWDKEINNVMQIEVIIILSNFILFKLFSTRCEN